MKIRCLLSAFLIGAALPGLSADAVWNGAEDAALNEASNWTGGSPFYDASTNPDTPLCFNASAKATLTADMTAYQIKTGAGDLALDFNLGSKILHLMGSPIDWNATTGGAITFKGGTLRAVAEGGATNKLSLAGNSTVVLDGADYTGNFAFPQVSDAQLVLTNGTKVCGAMLDSNYPTRAKVVVAGEGTLWDLNRYALRFGNRYANRGLTNNLYVTDGAVVTNFGAILTCDSDSSGKGFGPMSDGSVFEFSNGARGYALTGAYPFSLCAFGGNNAKLRVLSGAKLWVNGLGIGRNGNGHEVEVSGKGSLLYCRYSGSSSDVYFGYRGSGCRLWVHDCASVTNATALHIDGYFQGETHHARVDVTDGADLYVSGGISMGSKGGHDCRVTLDNGAYVRCNDVSVGGSNNCVFVGHESTLDAYGSIVEFASGAYGRLVISNGTLNCNIVNNRCGIRFYNGTEVLFAGRKPRIYCDRSYDFGACTLTFDIPAGGVDSSDGRGILHCAHTDNYLNIPDSVTPVFRLKDYIRSLNGRGETIILLSSYLGPINHGYRTSFDSTQLLAKWQKILDDGYGDVAECTLSYNASKSVMYLDVKRKYGFLLLVR